LKLFCCLAAFHLYSNIEISHYLGYFIINFLQFTHFVIYCSQFCTYAYVYNSLLYSNTLFPPGSYVNTPNTMIWVSRKLKPINIFDQISVTFQSLLNYMRSLVLWNKFSRYTHRTIKVLNHDIITFSKFGCFFLLAL